MGHIFSIFAKIKTKIAPQSTNLRELTRRETIPELLAWRCPHLNSVRCNGEPGDEEILKYLESRVN